MVIRLFCDCVLFLLRLDLFVKGLLSCTLFLQLFLALHRTSFHKPIHYMWFTTSFSLLAEWKNLSSRSLACFARLPVCCAAIACIIFSLISVVSAYTTIWNRSSNFIVSLVSDFFPQIKIYEMILDNEKMSFWI